jgi:hypothetical protein
MTGEYFHIGHGYLISNPSPHIIHIPPYASVNALQLKFPKLYTNCIDWTSTPLSYITWCSNMIFHYLCYWKSSQGQFQTEMDGHDMLSVAEMKIPHHFCIFTIHMSSHKNINKKICYSPSLMKSRRLRQKWPWEKWDAYCAVFAPCKDSGATETAGSK